MKKTIDRTEVLRIIKDECPVGLPFCVKGAKHGSESG